MKLIVARRNKLTTRHSSNFGQTDLEVSRICYGTWEIGGFPFYKDCDRDTAIKLVQDIYEIGINFFDTAPVYGFGLAEEYLGEAIKGFRKDIVISTKCGLKWTKESLSAIEKDASREAIRSELDDSLRRLQTDYIDLYLIHWPDLNTPIQESIQTLEELKVEGKIRYYGVSNFSLEQMQEAQQYGSVSGLQSRFSRLRPEISLKQREYCVQQGIGIQAYSPLERGLLCGKSVEELKARDEAAVHWVIKNAPENADKMIREHEEEAKENGLSFARQALHWVFQQEGMTTTIVGSCRLDHVRELISRNI
jgi:aryl-alcohol dehydrogenase-like predicted oxidoreductase